MRVGLQPPRRALHLGQEDDVIIPCGVSIEKVFEYWLLEAHLGLWEEWQVDAFDGESAWEWAETGCPDVLSEFEQLYKQEETNDGAQDTKGTR